MVLLGLAILAKFLGAFLPAWPLTSWRSSMVLGVSIIPRAEITMIVMKRGHELGAWAVSDVALAAMLIVSLASSLIAPVVTRFFLNWGQSSDIKI
jgi:hypothetical protein